MRPGKMAPASGCGVVRGLWVLLAVLALAQAALAFTEQYPALSLLKQELYRQHQGPVGGCASAGEWAEQYSAECGESGRCVAMVTTPSPGEGVRGLLAQGHRRVRPALRSPEGWGAAGDIGVGAPRPCGRRPEQKRKARPASPRLAFPCAVRRGAGQRGVPAAGGRAVRAVAVQLTHTEASSA